MGLMPGTNDFWIQPWLDYRIQISSGTMMHLKIMRVHECTPSESVSLAAGAKRVLCLLNTFDRKHQKNQSSAKFRTRHNHLQNPEDIKNKGISMGWNKKLFPNKTLHQIDTTSVGAWAFCHIETFGSIQK